MISPPSIEGWLEARRPDETPKSRLKPGESLGEWRVVAFLGAGLSAEVYRVINSRFGQEGALKLLVDGSRGLRERFLAEADAIRFLSLRALPRFMGSGDFDGMPYYVMEYLRPLPDPMPRGEVPVFMNRVAKAVHLLHRAGYIHRDLKPGNLLLRANGEPVLIDLGLIKKRGTGVTDPVVRHGRGISLVDGRPVGVGTLDYAAPEQLLKGEATVQSDVFALGKILRALYCGHPPGNVKPIIRRATRELPGERYQSAEDFAAALRHRNCRRLVLAALAVTVLSGIALFPVFRPRLARAVLPILKPRLEVSVTHRTDESDLEYLQRLLPAAEAGDPLAQVAVAEAYYFGKGTPTNRTEAVRWYTLAAEAGDAGAQGTMGLCRFHGIGCAQDLREALRWYSLAADKGDLAAMTNLAYCRMHGIGTDRDEEAGFRLALSAAECGYPRAQAIIGECWLEGVAVTQDLTRAGLWLTRAARNGDRRAERLLKAGPRKEPTDANPPAGRDF